MQSDEESHLALHDGPTGLAKSIPDIAAGIHKSIEESYQSGDDVEGAIAKLIEQGLPENVVILIREDLEDAIQAINAQLKVADQLGEGSEELKAGLKADARRKLEQILQRRQSEIGLSSIWSRSAENKILILRGVTRLVEGVKKEDVKDLSAEDLAFFLLGHNSHQKAFELSKEELERQLCVWLATKLGVERVTTTNGIDLFEIELSCTFNDGSQSATREFFKENAPHVPVSIEKALGNTSTRIMLGKGTKSKR